MTTTEISRYLQYGKKLFSNEIRGLRPSAWYGRLHGPRVLMNGIPKCGTNLLERVMIRLPMLRRARIRTLMDWDGIQEATMNTIKKTKSGQFFIAHIPAYPSLLNLLQTENIRSVFMIRDPRDMVVSHFKYVAYIDVMHEMNSYSLSLPTDDARLMASIMGVPKMHSPINEVLLRYEPWLHDENTLVIRYEDLVGSRGGGDNEKQQQTVRELARHLGIVICDNKVARMCNEIFSSSSPTFRSGKIGTWRNVFRAAHIDAFKQTTKDLLIRYGYEQSENW